MGQKKVLNTSDYFQYQRDLKSAKTTISSIANRAENFKIGKTGMSIENRFGEPDYNGVYDEICSVYSSEDPDFVSRMEADLIEEFKNNKKCDNIRTTDQDDMADSEEYSVYVVWNNE